ncbi:MAG: sulfite exporter TauE/SafE family protein [Acidimicrobiia bacterium]
MEIAAVALAMVFGAVVKSVTGLGLPPVAIPVLAALVGVEEAVIIMALPSTITNLYQAWIHRSSWSSTRYLPMMLTLCIVASLAGAWIFISVDVRIIAVLVATVVLSYVVAMIRNPEFALPEQAARRTAGPVGFFGGLLQGSTGMSSTMFAPFLHSLRPSREAFILSISLLFCVSAFGQLAGLISLGAYSWDLFGRSVLATVLVMAVLAYTNRKMVNIPRKTFDRAVMAVQVGTALKLLYDAFARGG